MTPFELSLENDLEVESRRFGNDWLFKWHALNYGKAVDVDRFDGGRICYQGITFGNQQQTVFWQAVELYLTSKVHEIFKRWNVEMRPYSHPIRLRSIDGVERTLRRFVARIVAHAVDTDRRLRGSGYPQNVDPFNGSGQEARAGAQISNLSMSHRLLEEEAIEAEKPKPGPVSHWRWLEDFYANNKGLIWLMTAAVASAGTLVHYLWK